MNQIMKSTHSTEKALVRFVNKTKRVADIYWSDYQGVSIHYYKLMPGAYVDIDTFTTHPWSFEDNQTGDALAVNNQLHFFPPRWQDVFRERYPDFTEEVPPPRRVKVNITLPIYSLRERCLQVVRNSLCCASEEATVLALEQLELPKSLQDDLFVALFRQRYNFYQLIELDELL